MTEVTVVVGAQFGSEGKGAIAAHLTRKYTDTDLCIRVAGPNAGHTAYDKDGREWKLRAVPVAAVSSPTCALHIAPGSEIDMEVLLSEINALDEAGHRVSERLTIDPSATILEPRHRNEEAVSGIVGRIGSTGKGIGAARVDRLMRNAHTAGQMKGLLGEWLKPMLYVGEYENVLIEGTQGYGLGLHTEFYPHVTSSDCRAIDFLAMAGISPWSKDVRLTVVLVARTYPIRVAGPSGPLKNERSWEGLGLPIERTTVTNKVRRVGEWDQELVQDAIDANGGGDFHEDVVLALTMLDHLHPEMKDATELLPASVKYIGELEDTLGCYISYVGTGPRTVIEL